MNRRHIQGVVCMLLGLVVALLCGTGNAHGQTIFINEIHYDNTGTDIGEAIEIAGPAGTDLGGWKIVRYNGATASAAVVYTSPSATETFAPGTLIPGDWRRFGVVVVNYPQNGLQNGPSDAIALVDGASTVVQFLSYGGPVVTAADGPAAGMTSTGIGVAETGTTPVGASLQLQGTGSTYADFTWAAPMANTFGACNTSQAFTGGDAVPSVTTTVPVNGSSGVAPTTPITVTFSEPVTAAPAAFSIDCGAGSLGFTLTGGPQTYTLTPTSALPSLASCTVAVFAAGVTDQDPPLEHPAADTAFAFSTAALFACGEPAARMHDIQGSGSASPLVNNVVAVEGIVVGAFQGATRLNGFYLQDDEATWDSDPATSEGIFIFDSTFGVPVEMGDRVRVQGRVTEFGTAGSTLTEVGNVTNVLVCSHGNAFPRTTVTLPVPSIGAWERYEGMAVRIVQPLTVTETFNLGSFGEVVLATVRLDTPTNIVDPGPDAIAVQDFNDRSRIIVDDGTNRSRQTLDPAPYPENGGLAAGDPNRTVRIGDRVNVSVPLDGVLDQRFGTYRIQPTSPLTFNPPDNPRPRAGVGERTRACGRLQRAELLHDARLRRAELRSQRHARLPWRQQRAGVHSPARQDHQRAAGPGRARDRADRAREQPHRVAAGPGGRPERRHAARALRVHQHGHHRDRRHQGRPDLPAVRRVAGGGVRRPRRLGRPARDHHAEPSRPRADVPAQRTRSTSSASPWRSTTSSRRARPATRRGTPAS